MIIEREQIVVGDIPVEVVRKQIKNIHLAVYPPDGRVGIAVPHRVDAETVRLAIVSRLGWIRRKQKAMQAQERQSQREMVTGETHYLWGRRYRLDVVERDMPAEVSVRNNRFIELSVRPDASYQKRTQVLYEWYRQQLKDRLPDLVTKWSEVVDVDVAECRVKKMKTRWGTCNIQDHRIWVNLELAKKPVECLEFVLVHEMVHLLERRHNDRFVELMNRFMPQWRVNRAKLNEAPLAHESWSY